MTSPALLTAFARETWVWLAVTVILGGAAAFVTGQALARVWMHNGFINVDNEKMSKSLGNFFTIRDVLKSYDAETVRFFVVRSHYRSPLNYSDVHLQDAKGALRRLYTALQSMAPAPAPVATWSLVRM